MRTRLAVILFVPLLIVLAVVGTAYAVSVARADQQSVYLDRLADTGYLVITARQSLLADNPEIVEGDLDRYRDVYGIDAAVLDQSGGTWASNGLEATEVEQRTAALAGRRSELEPGLLPWTVGRVVVAEPVFDGGDLVGAVVTVSHAGDLTRGVWLSWAMLLAGAALVCLLAAGLAHRTAGWVMRPVAAVDRAMAQIGSGRLDARIPSSTGPPELRAVVTRFNEMAARVEYLMRRQQEFVSNASHELRNPLNALMLRIEDLAMTTPPEHATEVAHVRAEAVRMKQILDALLLLADDADRGGEVHPLDVGELVVRRVDSWRGLAPERTILLDAPSAPLWGTAGITALECAFDAVLDNALKYGPPDAPLEVSVGSRDGGPDSQGTIEVTVRDHGPGVPPAELTLLTERFWRSPGHSSIAGSGLGLAIAAEILATGGGQVALTLPDDGGLRVALRVPRCDAVDPADARGV
ncbi:HAMP domain-containing histidine kinase [Isoptericola sp. NEAU-Y5]|uniref:histidine kinase n=1 Tax=Isoptericola luteus TaxID=2879484 RepID=A0ABS7ZHZ9_9MICO|nr:HAMP domain-containing sensor histidine kinase [Isoptericola sp. NEAU-Y5]MCA5894660.1 HAMP domain-containing histidine kinase [Isoptericola sp. NEAU-Y5]